MKKIQVHKKIFYNEMQRPKLRSCIYRVLRFRLCQQYGKPTNEHNEMNKDYERTMKMVYWTFWLNT